MRHIPRSSQKATALPKRLRPLFDNEMTDWSVLFIVRRLIRQDQNFLEFFSEIRLVFRR
jgi:hypothetical protein